LKIKRAGDYGTLTRYQKKPLFLRRALRRPAVPFPRAKITAAAGNSARSRGHWGGDVQPGWLFKACQIIDGGPRFADWKNTQTKSGWVRKACVNHKLGRENPWKKHLAMRLEARGFEGQWETSGGTTVGASRSSGEPGLFQSGQKPVYTRRKTPEAGCFVRGGRGISRARGNRARQQPGPQKKREREGGRFCSKIKQGGGRRGAGIRAISEQNIFHRR